MISRQFKQEPKNLIDTGPWARDLHCSLQSLQGLCAIFLREHLSKTHQQSNWKKENLSPGQIRYAATDAWISLKVYEEMKRYSVVMPTVTCRQVKYKNDCKIST